MEESMLINGFPHTGILSSAKVSQLAVEYEFIAHVIE